MSDINIARRTDIEVFFDGTDITPSIKKYLISLTYTDNEEDETDDLQIKLQDSDGIWLEKWLNEIVEAAADSEYSKMKSDTKEKEDGPSKYKVIAKSGATIRSRDDDIYKSYGTLAYGTIIEVTNISNGWAEFKHGVNAAYVKTSNLVKINGSSISEHNSSIWSIGDEVTVTGTPQRSSSGNGNPGKYVSNHKGKITYLNLKSGIPYPIHVDHLGWFAEDQVTHYEQKTAMVAKGKADKGLKIQAVILRQNWNTDGMDDTLECGQFYLDSVVAQGPPATVNIKGTSLPYNSTIRQTIKSKSWESYTLSGIANEIADKNGMTAMYLSESNPEYKRQEQYKVSDIEFLKKLCHDVGCSLKVTNNIIVVFDQEKYEEKSEIKTIKRGESGYTKYKLSTEARDCYTSCRVSYINTSGRLIEATEYIDDYDADSDNNQCLEITQKVSSVSEAKVLAKKMLRLHNKYEFVATFSFPGDTKLIAGCTVKLEKFGAWDGKYIIKQAKHSVSSSGYTTQITLRMALAVSKPSLSSDSNKNTEASSSNDIDDLARAVIRGDYGNGSERKRLLGDKYAEVQARVNDILS